MLDQTGQNDAVDVVEAGVLPHAVIEPEQPENDDAAGGFGSAAV